MQRKQLIIVGIALALLSLLVGCGPQPPSGGDIATATATTPASLPSPPWTPSPDTRGTPDTPSPVARVPSPTPSEALDQSTTAQRVWAEAYLADVYMLSAREGWAVGFVPIHNERSAPATATAGAHITPPAGSEPTYPQVSGAQQGVLLHYNNGTWEVSAGPEPELGDIEVISQIQMVSPDQGWLIARSTTYWWSLWRLANGRWEMDIELRRAMDAVSWHWGTPKIHAVSADEVWVYGVVPTGAGRNTRGRVYHLTNSKWELVLTSEYKAGDGNTYGDISAFHMLPSGEGWLGGTGTLQHYRGGQWSEVNAPEKEEGFSGIHIVSPDEFWALDGRGKTILHYADGRWEKVPAGPGVTLYDIQMVSADEGWAAGERDGTEGVLMHYRSGKWERVEGLQAPILTSVHMLSADEGWAVGYAGTLFHYRAGVWERYTP